MLHGNLSAGHGLDIVWYGLYGRGVFGLVWSSSIQRVVWCRAIRSPCSATITPAAATVYVFPIFDQFHGEQIHKYKYLVKPPTIYICGTQVKLLATSAPFL